MTGPIIPADEWPEDAALHTWDVANGQGYWTVYDKVGGFWTIRSSHVPMPAGWDWRVPVIRHQPAPVIDLERLVSLRNRLHAMACRVGTEWEAEAGELQRDVQHLIDGQANVRSSSEHSSEAAANLVTDDAVRRLVRAMENTPGDELIEPNARLCRRLLAAALQPTKGEGE